MRIAIVSSHAVSLREVARDIAYVAQRLHHVPRLMDYYVDAWSMKRLSDACIIVMAALPVVFPPYALLNRDLLRMGVPSIIYTTVEGRLRKHSVQDWWRRDCILVANSEYTRDRLMDVGLEVVDVVPHGVNFEEVVKAEKLAPVTRKMLEARLGDGVIFLTVSTTHQRKGMDFYAGVVAKAVEKCRDCRFYILAPPEARKYFTNIPHVYVDTRYGKLSKSEILALYAAADYYIQPSFSEGFCLPVLESMAMGTPVIHVAYPPIIEFSDSKANRWVPYTDVSELDLGEGMLYELHIYNPDDMLAEIIMAADEVKKHRDEYEERSTRARTRAKQYDVMRVYPRLIEILRNIH